MLAFFLYFSDSGCSDLKREEQFRNANGYRVLIQLMRKYKDVGVFMSSMIRLVIDLMTGF